MVDAGGERRVDERLLCHPRGFSAAETIKTLRVPWRTRRTASGWP
ncbi:MAG TPA: hypothetical protein VGR26_00765 [Acidimicrobiales bacterium]|nr:hypothetical protein [Acidimicrobiales bacterium]